MENNFFELAPFNLKPKKMFNFETENGVFTLDAFVLKDVLPSLEVAKCIEYAGKGNYGTVFRISTPDMDLTIKLMQGGYINFYDIYSLAEIVRFPDLYEKKVFLDRFSATAVYQPVPNLIEKQIVGHQRGNTLFPQNVTPISCLWLEEDQIVGYSCPFISGKGYLLRTASDFEIAGFPGFTGVKSIKEKLKENHIYPGNSRGGENVIITNDNVPVFIDVRESREAGSWKVFSE